MTMILVGATTNPDKIQMLTSSAALIDVATSYAETDASTPPVVQTFSPQLTAFSSATTSDIVSGGANSRIRNVKSINVRNKDTALTCDVTIIFNHSATQYELFKATLQPGDVLEWVEGVGFFVVSGGQFAIGNSNTSDVVASAADTYLTGASLSGINNLVQAASFFRWRFTMTKTAAGIAAPVFTFRLGTAGTTADASIGSLTLSAQTAVVDTGWVEAHMVVRTATSSGTMQADLQFTHNLTTTGLQAQTFKIFQTTGSAINWTTSGLILGVSCNPGASGVWTFQHVAISAHNVA